MEDVREWFGDNINEDSLSKFLKYDGKVYTHILPLAKELKKDRRTLKKYLDNNEIFKLADMGIEIIYGRLFWNKYWVCTDGEVRTGKKGQGKYLHPLPRAGKEKNKVRLTFTNSDGVKVRKELGIANCINSAFVTGANDFETSKVLFSDRDLSNCALSNLRKWDKSKEKKKSKTRP